VSDLEVPELVDPVMLIAFEGWNDAGESATAALDHLHDTWQAETLFELDAEDYYDFQVNRPHMTTAEDGSREIEWPATTFSVARIALARRDVVIVRGVEPNIRWRSFSEEILGMAQSLKCTMVIAVGALLSDTAHTRPIPITATSNAANFPAELNFARSEYEGPTGILGVLIEDCSRLGIPAGSLWAQVPHYVATSPCPKATLALLSKLEEVLDIASDLGDRTEEAAEWERDVDTMASDDEELSSYVRQLENTSGEESADDVNIADEIERYLRRRNSQ